jgi:hypothetical protein
MRTRIVLLALLSAAAAPVFGQVPTTAAVMRVDPATQRQRDQSRGAILQDELVLESLALRDAQRQARAEEARADGRSAQEAAQRVARHRQNISALAREIVGVERQTGAGAGNVQPTRPTTTSAQRMAEEWFRPEPPAPEKPDLSAAQQRPSRAGAMPQWVIPAAPAGQKP